MKKYRLIIALLAVVVACACFSVGCRKTEKTQEPKKDPQTVVIADFETWETGIQLIRTHANFGKISWNKDIAYVKQGIGSAKLQPLGGYDSGTIAQFFYPTYSEQYDIDNRDFSKAKSVTFEFYNAEERELKVAVGLVTSIIGPTSWNNTVISYQNLPPKQWTTITYEVNTSLLSISCDVKSIQGIYVAFENQGSRDVEDAPVVYLDNIVLHKYETAPEIEDLMKLGENEYMDFESPEWQSYVVNPMDTGDAPTIAIVESAAEPLLEGVDPQGEHLSGKNSLKIVAPAASSESKVSPGVEFVAALLQKSLFYGLAQNMYGSTTFKFELYNASNAEISLGMRFVDATGKVGISFSRTAPAKSWITVEYNIKDLYEDYREQNTKMDLFTNPGAFRIRWDSWRLPGETVLFVDNMRFEQIERDTTVKPTLKVAPFVRQAKVGTSISLPNVEATDEYDLSLDVVMKVFYQSGEQWEKVDLTGGKIPVDKKGTYKIVVSSTNSLGNTEEVECYFEGVDKARKGILAEYSFKDEIYSVRIGGRTETNKVTHLSEVTVGGETRQGVLKVETDNMSGTWGVGFVGFAFAKDYLQAATDGKWQTITFNMYIETEVNIQSVMLFSSSTRLTNEPIKVGQWVQFSISKDVLNSGTKNYINTTGSILSDELFYDAANEAFDMFSASNLFYIATNGEYGGSALKNNPKVTYYIDEVTWEGKEIPGGDGDIFADDIYGDDWKDDNSKRRS